MAGFEKEIGGLPARKSGFHYVPMPNLDAESDDRDASSVEGVRTTQAAELTRKLFNLRMDPGSPIWYKQLLRAAIMEVLEVSDAPFERRTGAKRQAWHDLRETYGERCNLSA